MPAPKAISSFSLSHVGILDGTTSAELADLFGANESSLELESDVYERQGDDKILSTARWITKGTLTVGTNYIPLPLISSLYGTAVVSSQIATKDAYTVQLWTEKGMNVAPRPVVFLLLVRTRMAFQWISRSFFTRSSSVPSASHSLLHTRKVLQSPSRATLFCQTRTS